MEERKTLTQFGLTQLEHILQNLPGGVAIYKVGKTIKTLYYSDGILRLTGHEKKEYDELVKDNPIAGIVYEEDQADMLAKINTAASTGASISLTYRIKHKNGSLVWIQLSANLIQEEADGKLYYAVFTKPVKEAEIYQHIVDNSETAVFIAEKKTRRLIFTNQAWKRLRNLNQDEYVGDRLPDIISARDLIYTDAELAKLPSDHYAESYMISTSGQYLHIRGRAIDWSGYDAYVCYISDETELWNSRAMLDAAMKSAKMLVWKYDYRTHTITDSGSLEQVIGLPKIIENVPESLIEMGFIHEDSIENFRAMFRDIPKQEKVVYDIHTSAYGKRKSKWDRQIYTSLYDSNGNYIESIGTAIDVTAQKEREKNYEEQTRLKHLLVNNALAVVHYNLSQNEITDAESSEPLLMDILKSGSADDVLRAIRENTPNETEQQAFAPAYDCQTMIAGYKQGETHFVIRHHLKNDSRWFESDFNIISNPYAGDIEAVSALHDISELVRAESIVDVLLKIDYESITTIDASTGAAKAYARGHIQDVIAEQKRVGDNVKGVASYLRKYCAEPNVEKVILETSLPYVKKRLEKVPVHTVAYSLQRGQHVVHSRVIYTYLDNTKNTILCAMQDLTETYEQEKQQKETLAHALAEAENANHAKTEFFSRMSHDMRTPMNGILGLAELSMEESDVDTLKSNMAKIKESGNYLLSLINDTLDFQRIESGKLKLSPQIVAAHAVLENITDIILPAVRAKNIDFQLINLNTELDVYVHADPARIKQIFLNLLSNAVKFTPEGGAVTFEIQCLRKEGMVSCNCFRITDTGVGMSEHFINNELYKPFSQEHNEISANSAGSGLGLSIVHSLVEMMGGKIEVASKPGIGTTFTLYLNFEYIEREKAEALLQSEQKKQSGLQSSLAGKHILLVEDHPLNAEIAEKFLEKAGCSVQWADNGQKGVDAFKASALHEFDAVLMDIRMPVLNGLDAARAIRSLTRADAQTIPIISMTANAYEEDVKQALDAGMNFHLSKPVNPAKLYETLIKYI